VFNIFATPFPLNAIRLTASFDYVGFVVVARRVSAAIKMKRLSGSDVIWGVTLSGMLQAFERLISAVSVEQICQQPMLRTRTGC
jgi:hypothetical protein